MTAKGQVVVAAIGASSVKLRPVLDTEQLDPFSHGGYQPEPAGPASDPIVEVVVATEPGLAYRRALVQRMLASKE